MPTDAELRGYLLGEASDDASEGIERAYLAREEALETVAEAERALIDDCLSGRLAPEARALFETRYLASPRHRQRVAIARALRGRSAAAMRGSRWVPWAPWALAAALAVGLLGVVWRLQAPAGGQPVVIAVTLPAVVVRGEGETPTVTVADDAAMIELRLERADAEPCAAPTVTVRTVEGREVWRGPGARETGGTGGASPFVAVVRVPARQLPDGDYVALLTCGPAYETPLQRSSFRVVRR